MRRCGNTSGSRTPGPATATRCGCETSRATPFADWLTAMIDTELDEAGTLLPPVPSPVALSRADFGPAVRALLRDLHAPDRLRGNPLLDSRLAVPGDPVPTLTQRVQQAVDQLAQAPRLDVAARAIVRTFLRPAGSQDRAAEMLGLPFSTYRRHLANGLERLEALLWDWELHGPPPLDDN
jgi:hypothetical protein